MSLKTLSPTELLQYSAQGWNAGRDEFVREFVARWLNALRATPFSQPDQINITNENAFQFQMDLSGTRLHGADNVICLAIGGSGATIAKAVWSFWHRVNSTDRLVFILALSDDAFDQAAEALPNVRCLRLRPEQIIEVLISCEPREKLKEFIRQQIPRHQLIPYNITQPVNSNMFFGRQAELDRLFFESDTSFAIAGAGRLGKTSLGLQFHSRLVREHDPRAHRRKHVDFYDCTDKTSDGVARFLAMGIEPSRRSNEMMTHDMLNFLKHQRQKNDGPLELFLDELDQVCHTAAFDILTMAARRGICRLILCGRGKLLKTVLSESSPLKGRVELLRLQPLDLTSAQNLVIEPLYDLGYKLKDQTRLLEQLFDWTGRFPHLLQLYCKRLTQLAMTDNIVSADQVTQISSDFETAQIFARQIDSLSDHRARKLAIHLLQDGRRFLTVPQVQAAAARLGFDLDRSQTVETCNDMVINNILAWHEDAYSIANHSLIHYARKLR
jgi:hypothetical protein